jgi:hypothetical protein
VVHAALPGERLCSIFGSRSSCYRYQDWLDDRGIVDKKAVVLQGGWKEWSAKFGDDATLTSWSAPQGDGK